MTGADDPAVLISLADLKAGLAGHDRAIRAEALREAANALQTDESRRAFGSTQRIADWLRERADVIAEMGSDMGDL